MHADRKALVLYEYRPRKRKRASDHCTIVPYPYLLIYSYSDCSTIMKYTGDRWIQLVRLQYVFVLHAISICICRRGCCRLVGEGILFHTVCFIGRRWNKCEVGCPKSGLTPYWHVSLTFPMRFVFLSWWCLGNCVLRVWYLLHDSN